MHDIQNLSGQRSRAQTSCAASPFLGQRVMLIAAHQDDEVLFAGAQLRKTEALLIVHATDGARSRRDARQSGFFSRRAYAATRQRELRRALAAGAVRAGSVCLNFRAGRSYLHLAAGARRLAALIAEFHPQILLTHSYDGGHIDHDTAAAMTHLGQRLSRSRAKIWE
ncbi:MAG: PIG-L deacetylase family protein, partial [Steroidobacteraceae bacterium]